MGSYDLHASLTRDMERSRSDADAVNVEHLTRLSLDAEVNKPARHSHKPSSSKKRNKSEDNYNPYQDT